MSLRSTASQLFNSTAFQRLAGLAITPSRWSARADSDFSQARRILIIKPDEIGDVVLATGLLRAIRRSCPHAHITVAVRTASVPLVDTAAMADDIFRWNDRWHTWRSGAPARVDVIRTARAQFRRTPPDWALIPRGNGDHVLMTLFAWWSGARRICAHEIFATEWGDRRSLISDLIPNQGPVHEVELHRRMLTFLGISGADVAPKIELPAAAIESSSALLAQSGPVAMRIALGIGAGSPSRVWPLANYQALLKSLLSAYPDIGFVVIGDTSNHEAGAQLAQLAPARIFNAAGSTSLLQSAAMLRHCQIYVGSDSGPMHLAAAAGCAIVEISKHPQGADDTAASSPVRFGPVARDRRILQPAALSPECATRGCDYQTEHCIAAVSVESVRAATVDLMAAHAAAR